MLKLCRGLHPEITADNAISVQMRNIYKINQNGTATENGFNTFTTTEMSMCHSTA